MRILFVAMAESIHTVRWINQFEGLGWDVHLFPSIDLGYIRPELAHSTVHMSFYSRSPELNPNVRTTGWHVRLPFQNEKRRILRKTFEHLGRTYLQHFRPNYRVRHLAKAIRKLKPDIVHSLEMQHGAYTVLGARELIGADRFPTWMVTNWGNDIYLFGRLEAHYDPITQVLADCDFYWCECERDVEIAKQYGLDEKKAMPVMPNSGGIRFEDTAHLWQQTPTSQRKQILLKAYQHWSGRALNALEAMKRCADDLHDYKILCFSASPDVKIAAELVMHDTGLNIEFLQTVSHQQMLEAYAQSRAYIGISISDGLSTSMVEAMAMGTFPIQTNTACTDEWFVNGESGFSVEPDDIEGIAQAIRRAVTEDELVDKGAKHNRTQLEHRIPYDKIRALAIAQYQQAIKA